FHRAVLRHAEHGGAAGADHLSRFNTTFQDEAVFGSAYIESAEASLRLAKLRRRDVDARPVAVARRGATIDVGLGDETAIDQRQRTIEFGLREGGIGARLRDRSLQLEHLLLQHRTVDPCENLSLSYEIASIDENRGNRPAFALHAHRHVPARGDAAD